MTDIILHHYDGSPFGRKVRAVLGLKQLSWGSCEHALMPPRPLLATLAGGYRRIPVLQRGADIVCDSNLILRVLDRLAPEPPLRPRGDALSDAVSQWFEPRMFTLFSALAFRKPADARGVFSSEEEQRAFGRDRLAFMAPMQDIRQNAERAPTCAAQVRIVARWVEERLEDGRPFLQGDAPTHADFSAFHPFHWLEGKSAQADFLSAYPRLWSWVSRLTELGEGTRTRIDAERALAVAREAEPQLTLGHDPGPDDPALGARVRVSPTDYGIEPVEGELTAIGLDHVSLRRTTPEAGSLAVHLPRWGYRIEPA